MKRWIFFLLAAASLPAHSGECNKLVISADSDYAPLHWYDGKKLTGASIDIATSALTALGIPFQVRYVGPFSRVLQEVRSGEVDMVTTLKITPERKQYMSFSTVPVFTNPIAVFVARDKSFVYENWKSLAGRKGGITMGNQFGNGFDEYLLSDLNVESAQKISINFAKLQSGALDYLVTGYYSGLVYLLQSKQADRFMPLTPYVTETDNFIAISKKSPCLKYLPRLNAQLESMRQTGELAAILEQYADVLKARYRASANATAAD
ncbi:transporter substrate-binding domain-containing protein [Herbaspirillum lusitanum]|jgi:polar amino acid transport system substrate-binding protein|uniref:Transporter substrate-binding domain-containing protein n=1 Tax=Herbaspirillum lusitanum TaxID=213312 RepID=A0ABW9AES1_9BURK